MEIYEFLKYVLASISFYLLINTFVIIFKLPDSSETAYYNKMLKSFSFLAIGFIMVVLGVFLEELIKHILLFSGLSLLATWIMIELYNITTFQDLLIEDIKSSFVKNMEKLDEFILGAEEKK